MIELSTRHLPSPIGTLRLEASADALTRLHLCGDERIDSAGDRQGRHAVLDQAASELDDYFARRRHAFSVRLSPHGGSDFQRAVWAALCEIPHGQTCTYGDLAKKLGRPEASRAVGGANHVNPIAIMVPCHRVIGAKGALTGYGGGLAVKRWLLVHEGALLV